MNADRNLLFGRFAVHNGFIDQAAFDEAYNQQQTNPPQLLAEILVQGGSISEEDRRAIEHLCERYVARHAGDPQRSLASLTMAPTFSYRQPPGTETVTFSQKAVDGKQHQGAFGDYELLGEIARGGMGVVYKARQTKLNRLVALKMIKSEGLADAEQVKRFYAEAKAAAKLDHRGIVPVHEVGEANGQHFYSMAFVEGRSLNDSVKQDGPLPPTRAAQMMKAVAEAVQYAHDMGIVHRDIKPQNILLDKKDQPRVADFGLAKQVEAPGELTMTGQVVGTPSYMPPEQATGAIRDIGPASDVYSVGATLYFLLTGRPPFQTASTAETIRQVIEAEPVPVRRLNPPVHRDLETICLKCLRKEPAKRYISAGDLAADLGRFLAGEPILARRIGVGERAVKWAKRRPAVAAMIGVTVVAILGSGIAVKLTQIDAAVRQAETEATAAREQAKTAVEALYAAPAIAVPYTLANLAPLKEFAIPLLRQAIDDSKADTVQRLHAAYALADLDEAPQDFLLADVATAPDAECRNLVIALEHIKALALPKLARRAQSAAENTDQARYAIVALHLGDPQPAKDALLLRDDPIHRTTLIHAYAAWHGNLSTAAELVRTSDDSAFRSGLCVAFGRISPDTLEQVERDMVAKALTACYTDAPDGGTHSAAGWALRQWKREPPAIAPASRPPSHRRWFVNGQGMTMVEVAPGKFTMDTPGEATPGWFLAQEVTLTKPFYLCDREVTIEQFQRFINDADYPAAEKPQAWKGAEQRNSPTLECPVQQVNWFDAVVYCNWLSMREGRKLCYERTGEKAMVRDNQNSERECEVWRCDFTADGYRLPTEAEWEYASRAGSAGAFCFGSDEDLLPQYAWFIVNAKSRTWPGAMKKPSAFGLFDMQGNVWEWCWDWCGSYSADPVSDPTGPVSQFSGSGRVLRGGAFNDYASSCHSGARYSFGHPAHRYYHFSFRVSCGR